MTFAHYELSPIRVFCFVIFLYFFGCGALLVHYKEWIQTADVVPTLGIKGRNITPAHWEEYITKIPSISKCLMEEVGWKKDWGRSISDIYRTLSQRIHPGNNPRDLQLSQDEVVISEEWLTNEQCLAVRCLLRYHQFPCIIMPIQRMSDVEESGHDNFKESSVPEGGMGEDSVAIGGDRVLAKEELA